MAYKTVRADKMTTKIVHMALHFVAICMGIVGINAAFKFHDMIKLEHMFSLHSWIGIVTFCLYGLQVHNIICCLVSIATRFCR